jgi:GTP-binding protein
MRNAVVAIVGRPNVGKSTLFNRFLGRKVAVVHEDPGVTRDRNVAIARWGRRSFFLVDTGGYVPTAEVGIEALVKEQASLAIETSSVVIFVVDGESGVTPLDKEIARLLREQSKHTILVVNKLDNPRRDMLVHEFHSLGMGEPFPLSALHGIGTGELLEKVVESLGEAPPAEEPGDAIRVAVIGKPNVGKSSLVNRLLHEKRMLVDEQPGTTRDSVDSLLKYEGHDFVLIDTAGLRRKRSVSGQVEVYCVVRAIRSVERANVVFVLFDASVPLTAQDTRIAALAHRSGKASVVVFNKWDLVKKDSKTAVELEKLMKERMPFLRHTPVAFVSALTGQRVSELPTLALSVLSETRKEVGEEELTRALQIAVEKKKPPVSRSGSTPSIKRAYQSSVEPPTFTVITTDARAFRKAYILYLIRCLREKFGFKGTPIRLKLRTAIRKRG